MKYANNIPAHYLFPIRSVPFRLANRSDKLYIKISADLFSIPNAIPRSLAISRLIVRRLLVELPVLTFQLSAVLGNGSSYR